jgi:hypothetical protein
MSATKRREEGREREPAGPHLSSSRMRSSIDTRLPRTGAGTCVRNLKCKYLSAQTAAKVRASIILREFEHAQTELIGKAVILTDGKAGTVESVLLDEVHGLRVLIRGHDAKWPVSKSNSRKATIFPAGRFSIKEMSCRQIRFRDNGVTGGPAEPHSSQTYFSERPHRVHRKVMKSGLVSLTSFAATIMSVPQSKHAGSSPVSKG